MKTQFGVPGSPLDGVMRTEGGTTVLKSGRQIIRIIQPEMIEQRFFLPNVIGQCSSG